MKRNLYFYERFMGALTLINGVIVTIILCYFSYNFISNIFTNSVGIAIILALAVESTKIITNFYASSFSSRGIESVGGRLLNNFLRIFAIVLSSVFCLSEVSDITNRPNLEKVKTEQLAETNTRFNSRREVLLESYRYEKKTIYEQIQTLSDLRYPTNEQKKRLDELDVQLKKVLDEEKKMLKQTNSILANKQDTLAQQIISDPSVNNPKVNDILYTLGVKPGADGEYNKYYRYFSLLAAFLLTIFLEFASITTIRNFTKFLYDSKRYKL